jgi:hypothetical protein
MVLETISLWARSKALNNPYAAAPQFVEDIKPENGHDHAWCVGSAVEAFAVADSTDVKYDGLKRIAHGHNQAANRAYLCPMNSTRIRQLPPMAAWAPQ